MREFMFPTLGIINGLIPDSGLFPRSIKERWTGLTNSLGGLFCSSLNNLDSRMTVSPVSTFFPSNPLLSQTNQPFFHALLPLEHPCTENLTPFLSLLPCRGKSGIAQLLNPHKLFDANWQRLGIHIVRLQGTGNLQVKLEFEVVQDPVRMTASLGSQPRRGERFPAFSFLHSTQSLS
jgi:phosphatidylinositol glycan class T